MNLNLALEKIGQQLGLNTSDLIAYAQEDSIGGFDLGKGVWEMGSVWSDEGKYLYALVRGLRPARVLELGTNHGCSACHILSALDANGKGKLVSVDLYPHATTNPKIPESLKDRWTFEGKDFNTYLDSAPNEPRNRFDIVFEDGGHGRVETEEILRKVALRNPTLVVSHDAEHTSVGRAIRGAFATVYPDMQTVLLDGTDCGFAYHIDHEQLNKKDSPVSVKEEISIDEPVVEDEEEMIQAPVEKAPVKRPRAKKAAKTSE